MTTYSLTVANKNGSYDGDMKVLNYTSLTVSSGNELTVDQPCRGLLIYVQGDCTINGTLRMKARAPYANPTTSGASDNNAVSSSGLRFPFLKAGGSDTLTADASLLNGCGTAARSAIANHKDISSNGVIATLVRQGANGGGGRSSQGNGNNGSNGGTGQTGGGGGGSQYSSSGSSGGGVYGSCWGGGSGGGGSDAGGVATSATIWCGPGGNGAGSGSWTSTGGGGNPAGTNGASGIKANYGAGYNGGGALILIVGGNLTIGASGVINANGHDMPRNSSNVAGAGGGAGGGNILIAHRGTYTNNGTVEAVGGLGDRNVGSPGNNQGGGGGTGSVQVIQIA